MNDRLLPPGLIIEQEITPPNDAKFGIRRFIVRDERWDPTHAPRRHVRVFPDLGRTNWGSKLQERLDQLFERPLPHVSRPLEIAKTVDGQGTYVVTDWYECTLAMRIAERGLVDDPNRALAGRLFGQLAEGLETLHGAGLPHGAFCTACVSVDPTHETAWIDGAAWGPLWYWTEGDYVDADAVHYLAPECRDRKSTDPSEKADLYALGRIGIEMLAGQPPRDSEENDQSFFNRVLRDVKVGRARRRLLLSLITKDPRDRPPDATAVLRHLRRLEGAGQRLAFLIGAVLALVIVVMLAIGYWFRGTQLRGVNENLANLKNDCDKTKGTLDATERQLDQERQSSKSLKKQLDDLAQSSGKGGQDGVAAAKALAKKTEQEADRLWFMYAKKNGLSVDNLRHIFQNDDSIFLVDDAAVRQKVRKTLLSWLAQFERRSGESWKIRFSDRPDCEEGSACIRGLEIYVDGEKKADLDLRDAASTKIPPQTIEWKVNQPIRIVLYDFLPGEGRTWKSLYLVNDPGKWKVIDDREFAGPVALWPLKRYRLSVENNGPSLNIEVEDCESMGPMPKPLINHRPANPFPINPDPKKVITP